jgi:hypothetical protein
MFDMVTTEDTAAWTTFLRSRSPPDFQAQNLSSHAHGGIKTAIQAVLAEASSQR